MASGPPIDPLQTLATALVLPSDSKEQADILVGLREHLEIQPAAIPVLCVTLLGNVLNTDDTPFKRWILDLFNYAISRSTLTIEVKTDLASQCLSVSVALLADPSAAIVKIVIQCFASTYPLLFRFLCTNRTNRQQWEVISQAKRRILDLIEVASVPIGVRLSALKFLQRVILVQTRGVTDPRLQNKGDPNISMCPSDHPFISATALEAEGSQLLTQIITILYTSSNHDILSAILNTFGALVKLRPNLTQFIVPTLTSWTPASLNGQSASAVKSVEKIVRILLAHIARIGLGAQFAREINEAITLQTTRMDQAANDEFARRAAENRKRSLVNPEDDMLDAKRAKVEQPPRNLTPSVAAQTSTLLDFDFTALSTSLVTDLILANLLAVPEQKLQAAIEAYRNSNLPKAGPSKTQRNEPSITVKDEPLDPLQMDIDEDDIEFEPERLNQQLLEGTVRPDPDADEVVLDGEDTMGRLRLEEFRSSAPRQLADPERSSLVKSASSRIFSTGEELAPVADAIEEEESSRSAGLQSTEMWMLLIVRLITRGLPDAGVERDEAQEKMEEDSEPSVQTTVKGKGRAIVDTRPGVVRKILCDYIMADFSSRVRLATLWMNEEWYNDRIRSSKDPAWQRNYEEWLHTLLEAHLLHLDPKDKTFSGFLLDLPSIPANILELLRELCIDQERMQTGFITLRKFVSVRPPLRGAALNILLELTTHPEKVTRGAAIITVKRWIPDIEPMNGIIRDFALRILRRLTITNQPEEPPPSHATEVDMDAKVSPNAENGASDSVGTPDASAAQDQADHEAEYPGTPYLPDRLQPPVDKSVVLQHVELLFALCVKVPEFLDEIFATYGKMAPSVQEAIRDLITALIRSLGSNHARLLTLLRSFPPGAESLALRILTILTEKTRPSAALVSLVKTLILERNLDARFLIPIIAEMDKADIQRYLPRIVATLNGNQEEKHLVRSVFGAIVTTPPQSFGTVSSNLPRVRQSELLTPAELMILLHGSDINLKSAIEAIGICFSMTDVFRSEILAVVMQQILDQSELPVLFLRTVIQAVTTYKSLVPFVSTTLLSRLITKKIWTDPKLWQGFIHCAKVIAPASFGALLQLPKEQLREIVDKQPSLKSGLREHLIKKAGNKARLAGFLDVFGEEGSESPIPTSVPGSPAVS